VTPSARWRLVRWAGAAVGSCLLALALVGCQKKFSRLPEGTVDQPERGRAQGFAEKIYRSCGSGHFDPLGDEATNEMRVDLSPAKQKQTCSYVQLTFGDYNSMDYVETWTGGASVRIYRFKGHFSKTSDTPEIRIVVDKKGLVSGFWLKPWSDALS
jgi:hypothetical protein